MSKTDIAGIFPEEAVMWLVSAARTGETGSLQRIVAIDKAIEKCRWHYPERFLQAAFPICETSKRGQLHWRAKLSNQEIELIRQLHDGGMGVTAIAKKFSVHKSHISRVTRYRVR